MKGINGFTLGDFDSKEYGIIMTAPPPEIFAERDVEVFSIAGRSGDLTKDNGRYKNFQLPYTCAIFPVDGKSLRQTAIDAVDALWMAAGYQRLENTYTPDYFRWARITGGLSISSIVEQAGKFTLTFDCMPQRFLIDGETAVPFQEPSILINHTNEIALPLITVYGNGAGELSVGGVTVSILALDDQLTLDCEIQNAYRQVGEGAAENKNGAISARNFPALKPGINTVSWTGGITKVDIIPRWWTL